jgi:hypothetical protein
VVLVGVDERAERLVGFHVGVRGAQFG